MVKVGINQASPGAMLQVDYDEGNSQVALRLRAYNASGSKTWQLSEINGNAGVFSIRNQTNSTEGLEIHADGHLRVPTGDLRVGDNTDSNAGTKTISVGSVSSGSGGYWYICKCQLTEIHSFSLVMALQVLINIVVI